MLWRLGSTSVSERRKNPAIAGTPGSYRAQSWDRPRRVVAKVEWHWDELFPRVGFIVTNMTGWSRKVVKFYSGRGTAEQWIKEGKYAVKWTRLSCRNFRDNQTHGFNSSRWRTTWGTFCVGWRCQGPRGTGR